MAISHQLESAGVVSSAWIFRRLGTLMGDWEDVKAGDYQLTSGMSAQEIFTVLKSGLSSTVPIVVPEGRNLYQIADMLEANGMMSRNAFLTIAKQPSPEGADLYRRLGLKSSLEGYLFPDTYFVTKQTSPYELVSRMVLSFEKAWTPEFAARAKDLGLTRHQVVTLASIIEKETGASLERPLISSVFHNRLKKHMRLQSDPTTIYGIWTRFNGNLRRSDLTEDTPYNTYARYGLPFGPIGNPGLESLRAALYPEKSEYLYFVSRNDGTHQFTRTFEEHSKAVQSFQLNPAARQGKSWRDLSRKPQASSR